ncbi:MAG: bifunctional pyr operon transcriptional regulator/uracil phosphoribosyltransferase [Deltaproteobacteria bacterium RBG_13_65_10]|nr:MAG: bifunctional pyr operon transcriptional regulator/uracil phosphoribosyltransferase [Deltaproteobacteria bacterium RBG_13_65_10]
MDVKSGDGKARNGRVILDREAMEKAILRIAHEIVERSRRLDDVVLLAIPEGGVALARRIRSRIREINGMDVPLGILDITLYRDDVATTGVTSTMRPSEMLFDVTDKRVILVDDVLFTGRTTRAALDAIVDFGRPQSIQLAVLIDRGHRELPIKVDYVGKNIPTSRGDDVHVEFSEEGNADRVVITVAEGETCRS